MNTEPTHGLRALLLIVALSWLIVALFVRVIWYVVKA